MIIVLNQTMGISQTSNTFKNQSNSLFKPIKLMYHIIYNNYLHLKIHFLKLYCLKVLSLKFIKKKKNNFRVYKRATGIFEDVSFCFFSRYNNIIHHTNNLLFINYYL